MGTGKHFESDLKEVFGFISTESEDLKNHLLDKLKVNGYMIEKHQILQNTLKIYFADKHHRSRQAIRHDTPLAELISRQNRPVEWRKVQVETGITLPRLIMPPSTQSFFNISLIFLLGLTLAGKFIFELSYPIVIVSGAILMTGMIMLSFNRSYRTVLPYKNLGQLAKAAVPLNFKTLDLKYASEDLKLINKVYGFLEQKNSTPELSKLSVKDDTVVLK